jgi:hypothetical protein
MHKPCAFVVFLSLLTFSSTLAFAEDSGNDKGRGWALDAKVGTLGFGADLSRSIVPRVLNLRVGASFFSYTADFSEEGINYRGQLRLGAVPIALDVFPFKNWLRIGGGALINLNEVRGTAQPSGGTLTIGDRTYNAQDVGQLDGKVKFERVAPFVGLGFSNPIKDKGHHWGFFADLGILYHGTPNARLTSSKSISGLQDDINRENQSLNNEIKDYKIFPVIQLGISYHF